MSALRSQEEAGSGSVALTQRQLQVLQLMAEGATNSEISERLHISPRTTKNHVAAISHKLGTSNRTKAVVRALELGLINAT